MSIWQKAYETYENHAGLAGVEIVGRQTLTPIGHIVQKTQIEIVLRADGSFDHALGVDQKANDCKCIIPATETSASRTQKPVPHPLCEQLKYLIPGTELCHAYLEQLAAWANSPFTTPKVQAILDYVRSGTILQDLAQEQLIALEADKSLAAGKTAGTEYEKCMIRWRVYTGEKESAVWKDKTLFDAYLQWIRAGQENTKQGLCMISGQMDVLTVSHPKGTLANAYGAKLISSNDSSGFTYRGRFQDPEQAASIGYFASQKVHSALQWLCANQGVIKGNRTFLCWNPKGKPVFQMFNPFETDAPAAEPSDY